MKGLSYFQIDVQEFLDERSKKNHHVSVSDGAYY